MHMTGTYSDTPGKATELIMWHVKCHVSSAPGAFRLITQGPHFSDNKYRQCAQILISAHTQLQLSGSSQPLLIKREKVRN